MIQASHKQLKDSLEITERIKLNHEVITSYWSVCSFFVNDRNVDVGIQL